MDRSSPEPAPFPPPPVTPLGILGADGPELSVLRLERIHPAAPGNKWYKLRYNLLEATAAGHRTVLTFGGPWSNHIAATAATCRTAGMKCIGVIRGEEPAVWSDTLADARAEGMTLDFVSRARYAHKDDPQFIRELHERHGEFYLVPEGGNNPEGIRGCREILSGVPLERFTHIALPVGTGATFRGVADTAGSEQKVWGFSAVKRTPDPALEQFCSRSPERLRIITDYTFGGFARVTPALLAFMQEFLRAHGVLLDFVYTAKMMYGITEMARTGALGPGDHVLAIHTGGLQGNRSLDPALGLGPPLR